MKITVDFLIIKIQQMQRRDENIIKTIFHLKKMKKNKKTYDASHKIKTKNLKIKKVFDP